MDDSQSDEYEPTLFDEDYTGGATRISKPTKTTKRETNRETAIDVAEIAKEKADEEEELEEELDEDNDEPDVFTPEMSAQNIERIVISENNMMTSDLMNIFEMTEHVSIRAAHIAKFNNCMCDVSDLTDPLLMAKRELMERKSPLLLERERSRINEETGKFEVYVEYCDVNNMIFSQSYPEAVIKLAK